MPTNLAKVLAGRVKAIRGDLKQEEFAERLGVSQAHVSRLESGNVFKQMKNLGDALEKAGFDPLDLLTQEEPAVEEEARLRILARQVDPAVLRICIQILEREVSDRWDREQPPGAVQGG